MLLFTIRVPNTIYNRKPYYSVRAEANALARASMQGYLKNDNLQLTMTVVCFFFLIFADKEEKICQEKRRIGWVIQLLLFNFRKLRLPCR